MAPQAKLCPSCQTPAPLDAGQCARCGHTFRTKFVPDPATQPGPPRAAPPPTLSTPPIRLTWGIVGLLSLVALFVTVFFIGLFGGEKLKRLNPQEMAKIEAWHKTKDGVYLFSEFDSSVNEVTAKADAANWYRHDLIKVQDGTAELLTAETSSKKAGINWNPAYAGNIQGELWKTPSRSVQFVFDGHGVLTVDGKRYFKSPGAPFNNLEVLMARDFHKDVVAGRKPSMELSVLEGQEIR